MSEGPKFTHVQSPFIDHLQSMGWNHTTTNDAGSRPDSHPPDITLKLQGLVRNNFLDSFGGTRWMTYVIGEQNDRQPQLGLDGLPNGTSANGNGVGSSDNGASSGANGVSSSVNGVSSPTALERGQTSGNIKAYRSSEIERAWGKKNE